MIRAVMFDLDGTLADSLADLANATNHALTSLGLPAHPRESYRRMVGDGAQVLCERATPCDRQALVPEVLARMRAHYDEHCFDETRLYPGIAELVAALSARSLVLAVLSNKPDHFTQRMIAHYFPGNPFAVVRGHQAGQPLKPDPSGALGIVRETGIVAGDWLYLGDTNTDMETARAAGMIAGAVLWGFRDRAELEGAGAQECFSAPTEVRELVEGRG